MEARATAAGVASWAMVLTVAASTATAGTGWLETQKLVKGDGSEISAFGNVVALSEDVAIATNYQDSDGGLHAGAAYVFRYDGVRWREEQKLVASDAMGHESFGLAAAVSGDLAFVGARSDDDNGIRYGSVYVFAFDGTQWVEEQKLLPSDGEEWAEFGNAIALRGDEVLIGAWSDGENGTGAGAVYAFRRVAGRWVEQQKFFPPEGDEGGEFGARIAISGDVALIGGAGESFGAGAAYVYRLDGGLWVEQQKLRPANLITGSRFGISVALSGDLALVAAPRNQARSSGSVYYFRYDGTRWREEQEFRPSDGHDRDAFGSGLALSGDLALVGARGRDAYGFLSGAAYFFRFGGERWVERQQLFATSPAPLATFAPVDMSAAPLYDGFLPPGLWSFGWLMMDGATLVDRDRVLVLVVPCLATGAHCEAEPSDILAAPTPSFP